MAYVIDKTRFQRAMRERGFRSLEQLVRFAGVHRNTAHYYLAGAPVVPPKLEKLLDSIGLQPGDCFVPAKTAKQQHLTRVAAVVDQLVIQHPRCCYVLFGSRATGQASQWSDFDIGVYSSTKLPLKTFLALMKRKETLAEDLPVEIQLVNLNHADHAFLRGIMPGLRFMGGLYGEFLTLKEHINGFEQQASTGD